MTSYETTTDTPNATRFGYPDDLADLNAALHASSTAETGRLNAIRERDRYKAALERIAEMAGSHTVHADPSMQHPAGFGAIFRCAKTALREDTSAEKFIATTTTAPEYGIYTEALKPHRGSVGP